VAPLRGSYWVYTLPMCVIEAVAVVIGEFGGLHGEPAFWIPAAIAVATPLTVLASRVTRK